MNDKKILALDIGEKRTGVAVSDESKTFSFPVEVLQATKLQEWVTGILAIVEAQEPIESIVVGFPLNQDGEEGRDAQNINKYVAALQQRLQIPVIKWDERFTTVQAERALIEADLSRKKRRQVIDKVAATMILQSYLDSLRFQNRDEYDE